MGTQWSFGFHLMFITILFFDSTNTCLGARNNTTIACIEHERLALLKFKHSVIDASNMLSSWVGRDCCRWKRVHCNGVTRNIEILNLRSSYEDSSSRQDQSFAIEEYLVGNKLESSLAELKQLRYLDLSWNSFKGSRIPEFIGSLKKLTYLNLSHTLFSGNLPRHFGNLSNLKVLDLNWNPYLNLMTDDIALISRLSSLQRLDLSYNDLSEAQNHDTGLYLIPTLVELRLSGCSLSNAALRPLFNSTTTLPNIKHLDIGGNSFKGQVPGFFQNMTSLDFLDISNFDLSLAWNSKNLLNMIPSLSELRLSSCRIRMMDLNISTHSNLQRLYLADNSVGGPFLSVLRNMSSLRVLDISRNGLNSPVPIMPNLLELDLSDNKFKQIDDVGIWRQCHLKRLTLSYNYFNIEINESPKNVSECSQYALETFYSDRSYIGPNNTEAMGRMANLRELHLSNTILTGPIPKSLGSLRQLEILDLSHNQLTGPIPTFIGKLTKLDLSDNQLTGLIPESLGKVSTLKHLFLGTNQLTGPIPASLGKLVSLQDFSASSNLLNGTIPISIGKLTELQYLYIYNNFFDGVVTEAHFANLLMLKHLSLASNRKLTFNVSRGWVPPFQLISLNLSYCNVGDELPRWLQTQGKLNRLDFSNANISGPLPTWFQKMQIIPMLDLSHNKLIGPLTNLPNGGTYGLFESGFLEVLLMQDNLFNESIPWSLCQRKNLYVLNLYRNRLTGKLPKCLGNMQRLNTMIFSSNRLSGVIPSSIAPNASSLEWLNLNNNNFIGELPHELGNLRDLRVLDLGDNKFSGNIPQWIGEKLEDLTIFRLHGNNFTGRIPQSLCKNSYLRILDVAHNNLTGPIPHCLGELYGMVYTSIIFDFTTSLYEVPMIQVMKGVELEYTTTLQYVINMDLSSNKLVGEIPVGLTKLFGLVGLNLSNNHLSGRIPHNIGDMKSLISLDFSRNELTGTIPPSIASLNFLSYLNLSHNNLSGRTPTGNQLQTLNDPSIYTWNKDLCGDLLPKKCSNPEDLNKRSKKKFKVTHDMKKVWLYGLDIMSGFATGFWGVIGVLLFKKKWRRNLFMFAEVTMDKIHVAIVVRVAKMKRGREAA